MPLKTTFSAKTSSAQRGVSSEHSGPRNGQPGGADVLGIASQLRDNSPDAVLGAMNQASLTQGLVTASVVTVVLLAVLTIVPFLFGSGPSKKKGTKPTAAAAQNKEQSPAASQEGADGKNAGGDDSTAATSGSDPKVSAKALKKLGVDDVKKSNPKRNPLEDSMEDLLKDIK